MFAPSVLINWWVASTATRSLATVSAHWRSRVVVAGRLEGRDLGIDLNEDGQVADGSVGDTAELLIDGLSNLTDDNGFRLSEGEEAPVVCAQPSQHGRGGV